MKHAGPAALSTIDDLLTSIRSQPALTEKRPGIFYRKSVAFLHFHEDAAGLFADVKLAGSFERLPVNTPEERETFLSSVAGALEG